MAAGCELQCFRFTLLNATDDDVITLPLLFLIESIRKPSIRAHLKVGTCDVPIRIRFENFESAAHAVCRHATNYAHSLFNKNINLCAVCR